MGSSEHFYHTDVLLNRFLIDITPAFDRKCPFRMFKINYTCGGIPEDRVGVKYK